MKTTASSLDGLKKSLIVELPIDKFKQKITKILKNVAANAKIDGFRKGHIPAAVIEQHFGTKAKADATNELIMETLHEALNDAKLEPAEQPALTKVDPQDKTFSYTVEFEVFPEFEVQDFAKLKFSQVKVKITADDEQKALENLAVGMTEYTEVTRPAKQLDRLKIDFVGSIDGVEFPGGAAKDFELILGQSKMIKGFEEGLIATKKDQVVSLNLKFPADYQQAELAEKNAVFKINIVSVNAPKKPDIDDKFAQKLGEKDLTSLKKVIGEQMQKKAIEDSASANRRTVFDALTNANDFIVPKSIVAAESKSLLKNMQERMKSQNMSIPAGLDDATFTTDATQRVKLSLLVAQISKDEKIKVTPQQIDEKLIEMTKGQGENAQKTIDHYQQSKQNMASIEAVLIEDIINDLIISKAKITIEDKGFEEFIGHGH